MDEKKIENIHKRIKDKIKEYREMEENTRGLNISLYYNGFSEGLLQAIIILQEEEIIKND